jgi:deazaflavin-dependent oxidoreductase (nitroreductase family)
MDSASTGDLRATLDRVAAYEREMRRTFLNRVLQVIGPMPWFVAIYRRLGPKIDPWLMRVTKGRIATKVYGFPTLLLNTVGAKSGQKRVSPLFYVRDGDAFVVVGTNFGTEHHPAWTNNVLKNPHAEIAVGQETIAVTSELADESTFARLWPKFSAVYGGYDVYLAKLTHRTPRMFVFAPTTR